MRPIARPVRSAAFVAALAVPAIVLTGCGGSGGGASSSSSGASAGATSSSAASAQSSATGAAPTSPATKGDLAGITVGGTKDKPTVKIDGGKFTAKETVVKVITEGTGPVLKAGDKSVDKIIAVNGANGATVYDSFATNQAERWTVADNMTLTGLSRAIIGQKVGSRLLAAIPPVEAFGTEGNQQLKMGKDDTLVALIDITGVAPAPLKEPKGAAVAPKAGTPKVVAEPGKAATITVPKAPAPTSLQVSDLIKGDGAPVKAGQTVQVHYTGVLWADGKKFDSSYDHGAAPTEFPIGVGQVIKAWDEALVGKPIGSRLLIVAPPGVAYGDKAQGSIPANSTLVFVVDLLGAY